jgi:hypothetical protein
MGSDWSRRYEMTGTDLGRALGRLLTGIDTLPPLPPLPPSPPSKQVVHSPQYSRLTPPLTPPPSLKSGSRVDSISQSPPTRILDFGSPPSAPSVPQPPESMVLPESVVDSPAVSDDAVNAEDEDWGWIAAAAAEAERLAAATLRALALAERKIAEALVKAASLREQAAAVRARDTASFVTKVIELGDFLRARLEPPPPPAPCSSLSGFDVFAQAVVASMRAEVGCEPLQIFSSEYLRDETLREWRSLKDLEREQYRTEAAEAVAVGRLRADGSRPRRRRRGARRGYIQGGSSPRPSAPLGEG